MNITIEITQGTIDFMSEYKITFEDIEKTVSRCYCSTSAYSHESLCLNVADTLVRNMVKAIREVPK